MTTLPIKTLHITNFYHAASGGIGTAYRALMAVANGRQRQMRLVVPGERTEVEEVGQFARIYHIRCRRAPFFDGRYRLILPGKYLVSYRSELRRILLAEQPDLIEVCDKYVLNWLAGLIRRRWIAGLGRPTVVGMSCERMDDNVAAYLFDGAGGRLLAQSYMRNLYVPMFDFHVANSDYTAAELRLAAGPDGASRILVCQPGVDTQFFTPGRRSVAFRDQLVREAGGDSHTVLLLYAGRVSPEKNIPLLLDMMNRLAVDRLPDYRLIVAGSGPLIDRIKDRAEWQAPGRIRMLGQVSDRNRLADLYANSDAFVHPNPREPFGLAPLEAMASGCPTIVPNAGGVLSYANAGNAWIAAPNGSEFADAVRSVFCESQTRREKIRRARATAEQNSTLIANGRLFETYDELHRRFQAELLGGAGFRWSRRRMSDTWIPS